VAPRQPGSRRTAYRGPGHRDLAMRLSEKVLDCPSAVAARRPGAPVTEPRHPVTVVLTASP